MDQKLSCMITLITYIIRYTKSRLPFISSLYHHFYGFEDYFSQPRHQAVMTGASASGPTISGVKSTKFFVAQPLVMKRINGRE